MHLDTFIKCWCIGLIVVTRDGPLHFAMPVALPIEHFEGYKQRGVDLIEQTYWKLKTGKERTSKMYTIAIYLELSK